MKVRVPEIRSLIEDAPQGLRIIIPPKRSLFTIIGIIAGAIYMYYWTDMFAKQTKGSGTFFYVLTFVIVAWATLSHARDFLWSLVGKEVVEISRSFLSIRRDYFGLGLTRNYKLHDIHDLQYVPAEKHGKKTIAEGIGFNYRGKERRFGLGLEEAEVQQLLIAIQRRSQAIGLTPRPELISQ